MADRPVAGGHRPALDGLRGISVIAIILFHANVSWVHGGYWAVNVFFIVSGYLITGLLLQEYDRWGTVDLVRFYVRRAKRLLPAIVVTVVGVSVAARYLMGNSMPATTKGDALASLFYVANWRFIFTGQSYFEQFGDPSPFRHMWTLAIEEQYYLFFPALLLGLLALLRRRWFVTGALVLLIAASATAMFLLRPEAGGDASRIYYGTDTRMQDIFTGCALALGVWSARTSRLRGLARHRTTLDVVGTVGVAGLLAALLLMDTDPWVYPWGYLLFNTGFAVLILLVVELRPRGLVGRCMSWRPLAWVGELSYSLYLWHWPVIVILNEERTGLDGLPLLAARMAVAVPLAVGSFYLVENPIRRGSLSRWLTPARTGRAAVAALAVAALAMPTVYAGVRGTPVVAAGENQRVTNPDADTDGQRLLIVGDSVGFALGYEFPSEDFPEVSPTAEVQFGCGTAVQHLAVDGQPQERKTECDDMFAQWEQAVADTDPEVVVWSLGGWEVFDHVVDGEIVSPGSRAYEAHLEERLSEGLETLPEDVPVVIPNVPCYQQKEFVVDGKDLAPDRNDVSRSTAVNTVLEGFAADHEQVHVADTFSWLCPDGTFEKTIDGVQTREDGVHYTKEGSRQFWTWLMPQIREALGERQ